MYGPGDLMAALGAGRAPQDAGGAPKAKDAIISIPDTLESALAAANKHLSMMLDQGATMPQAAQEEIAMFFDLARALAERERDQIGPPVQGGSQGMASPNAAPGPGPAPLM